MVYELVLADLKKAQEIAKELKFDYRDVDVVLKILNVLTETSLAYASVMSDIHDEQSESDPDQDGFDLTDDEEDEEDFS